MSQYKVIALKSFYKENSKKCLPIDIEIINELAAELNENDYIVAGCDQTEIEVVTNTVKWDFFGKKDVDFWVYQIHEKLSKKDYFDTKKYKGFRDCEIFKDVLKKVPSETQNSLWVKFKSKTDPTIAGKFHVDANFDGVVNSLPQKEGRFFYTGLPSEIGPTTRYIDYDGTIEFPILKEDCGKKLSQESKFRSSNGIDRDLFLTRYFKRLIEKNNLKIGSMPPNVWVKTSDCFIHASPLYDEKTASDRLFCLILTNSF